MPRRCIVLFFVLLLAPFTVLAQVSAVVKVGFTVSDLDQALDFYTRTLDFQKLSEREVHGKPYEQLTSVFGLRCRIAELKLGDEVIELTEYLASPGRAIPRESRSNDRWFQHIAIITSDMDAAYGRLREHKVRHASTGPQRLPDWNRNAAGIRAFYFKDPDGHVLEILQFPPGKGEDRWQSQSRLFLGIDHTAIVVKDTQESLGFYRDALGLRVVSNSENFGEEQERLNNVEGARLRITTLAPRSGLKIELLEYLHPTDGQDYPADSRPNDLWHWQTTLRISDPTKAVPGVQQISRQAVDLPESGTTVLVRDPDGHALQLTGPPPAR